MKKYYIGCGTGLLGISSFNIATGAGSYLGIDVIKSDISYCKDKFDLKGFDFHHIDAFNATYSSSKEKTPKAWPLDSSSFDMATTLTLWTQFNERDALFYLKEATRVSKKNGIAILTFFIDKFYHKLRLEGKKSNYHRSNHLDWNFAESAYGSDHWKTTSWVSVPEDAIGIDEAPLVELIDKVGIEVKQYYPGTWKNFPGLYFQDIKVLRKK